jgi:hypothetical protein
MKGEKRRLFPIICFLVICILYCGCTGISSDAGFTKNRDNPESGIVNWMAAMNYHDSGRLYNLSPQIIKKQISKTEFIKVNEENGMFIDNITFVDYTVLNRTQSNNGATLKVQMVMATPDRITGNVSYSGIFYTFNEYFENNEWKVWASGLDP